MNEAISYYMDKVIEGHRHRQVNQAALLVIYVSSAVTAFRIDDRSIILISVVVPVLALLIDTIIKYTYITPFLYKAMCEDLKEEKEEGISYVFFRFGSIDVYELAEGMGSKEGVVRQKYLRDRYVFRNMWFKVMFYLTFSAGSMIMFLYFDTVNTISQK